MVLYVHPRLRGHPHIHLLLCWSANGSCTQVWEDWFGVGLDWLSVYMFLSRQRRFRWGRRFGVDCAVLGVWG